MKWIGRLFAHAAQPNDQHLIILLLGIAGLLRSWLYLAGYAPADGADAFDYYLYAAQIVGFELPTQAATIKSLLPLFIALNQYWLGNFQLIHIWHIAFSASVGVLVYLALNRFNPLLAVVAAVLVLADTQLGFVFIYVATEPLYVFLLLVVFTLILRARPQDKRALLLADGMLALALVLCFEVRTVATLLWVPILVSFALQVRYWRRILYFILMLLAFFAIYEGGLRLFGINTSANENEKMLIRPILETDILNASAAPATPTPNDSGVLPTPTPGGSSALATPTPNDSSAPSIERLEGILDACAAQGRQDGVMNCLRDQTADTAELNQLLRAAFVQSWSQHSTQLLEPIVNNYVRFLRMSGIQHNGTPTPADVQCAAIEERAQRIVHNYLENDWRQLHVTDVYRDNLTQLSDVHTRMMCPPRATNSTIRATIDLVGQIYDLFAPGNPLLTYGLLLLAVTVVPLLQRYWLPTVMSLGLLTYHALISAALANVQPRYVVVNNPFRIILALVALFAVAHCLHWLFTNGLSFVRKQHHDPR